MKKESKRFWYMFLSTIIIYSFYCWGFNAAVASIIAVSFMFYCFLMYRLKDINRIVILNLRCNKKILEELSKNKRGKRK